MEDLLRFGGETLGYPILYSKEEVDGITCWFTSGVSVPLPEFQGYFERLLISNGFLYAVSGEGSSKVHRVIHLQMAGRTPGSGKSLSVPLGELESYADRGIVVTTVIPLRNVTVRDMISSLTMFISQSGLAMESIRPVENANALVVTSFVFKVRQIAALCAEIDQVAGSANSGTVRTIHDLKKSMAEIKKKLAELEKRIEK